MTQALIKYVHDMAQVIHGVNSYRKLALYNLPLSVQILAINFFITIIGFIFLILFNYFLIKNDETIYKQKIKANQSLKNIQSFLEKNSIIRVPLFDDNCIGENTETCNNNNFELSDPVLEPKITQEFIINNYLNSNFDIQIYNDDWIRLVDTKDFYDLSIVQETDLKEGEGDSNNLSLIKNLGQKYISLFSGFYNYLIKRQFQHLTTLKKAEISYVSESIQDRVFKEYIINEFIDDNLYQYFTAPIVNNNKVYGVIIFSYAITNQASDLGFISLNIISFFILFVLIMIFMSFIFSRSLVSPIKKLSKLSILERQRVEGHQIEYPNRNDEIGTLSKEIQKLTLGLKSQIQQLEKFSADVSHELKNPLTSLQSAMELINDNNISNNKKNLLIKNIQNDIKRINQLITDISNFTRLKAEIELEKNQYIKLNDFLDEIPNIFTNNSREIRLILNKCDEDLEVVANKNKLIQVFINLIENSISLSPKRSKILIELSRFDEKNISLKFYDQGMGIDTKDSEKIFERFYSDRQENIKNHSGLGLSIAREIIIHMNGQLSLDKSDKSEYSGACFLIILPIRHFT